MSLLTTDRGGHATGYTFDAAGRMTTTTYADGTTSVSGFDSAGRVVSTTDRNGNTTAYAYDDAGRRTAVTDALGNTTQFVYDAAGEQLSVTDAKNNRVQYTYDADGRQTVVTYPDQTTAQTGYDALGRMTSKTDQAGVVTGYGYDALGRLTSVTQDVGGMALVTSYGYDELGNRVSQTDALGRTTKYAYDQLGRRQSRTLPLGQQESYAYDADGNLASKTDFNGHTTTYQYDVANRLLSKAADSYFAQNSLGAAQVTYTYTATGKRLTMADATGTTSYTYDPQTDRLTAKQTPFGTISYTYDAMGDVTEIASSNQNGSMMAYQYDKLNRLSTVTVPGQASTSYSYDAVGNLASVMYPNGVGTSYNYDTLNRLTNLASQGPQGALASYQYTLGAAGNRTSVTELSGRTVNYGYDNLYRLTSETIANAAMSGSVSYSYDAVGNRKQITSTLAAIPSSGLLNYDANDRTTTDVYDANGNTVSQAGIADVYDFENHLVQHGYITYAYDGDGNRVSKTFGGVTTSYLVDMLNPTGYVQVLDEVQSSSVTRRYAWGLQLVSQTQLTAAIQPPLSQWQTSWYGYDGHGSVRYLTGSTGTITDIYDYDAFGNLINSTGSTANNYMFAGEQFDPELGLYYNRARYLDVRAGRFWGMDTEEGYVADPVSFHKYLYAGADPVGNVDPSGNELEELTMANALSIGLMAMNAYSLVGNTMVGVQSSLAAYSAFEADDPWNGTIAIGSAILHFGLAAASAYGINSLKNLPPPPPTAIVTAAGNVGIQMLWLNPAFTTWAWGFLWPAVTAGVGIYAASTQHTAQWELRNSRGQIKTRGEAVSGGTGKSKPTWPEQRATDTEIKILADIESQASPGDILTIRGTKPPCNWCNLAMVRAAARLGIKILYSDGSYISQY